MDGDALVLEGLCPVCGLTAANNVGHIVALQLCEVEREGRVGRAVEDQEADLLGHGGLDQGKLTAQGHQSRAAGWGGQALEASSSRGVDGGGGGLCRD